MLFKDLKHWQRFVFSIAIEDGEAAVYRKISPVVSFELLQLGRSPKDVFPVTAIIESTGEFSTPRDDVEVFPLY